MSTSTLTTKNEKLSVNEPGLPRFVNVIQYYIFARNVDVWSVTS